MTLRLRRWQGKWIAEDKEAGYYSEMPDCDAYTLMADFHDAEHIRLRVQAAKDPAWLADATRELAERGAEDEWVIIDGPAW